MCRLQKTISAVLVAAGSSTRMGFDKLSFDLGGETVLHRSIRAFDQCPQIGEIVLVAGKNRAFVEQQAIGCTKPVQIVAGGATRAESAKNGVLAAHGERRTHREDLIGFGPKCLVRPRKMAGEAGKPSRGKGANGKGFGQKTANDRSGQGKAKTGGRPKKTLRNVHKKK